MSGGAHRRVLATALSALAVIATLGAGATPAAADTVTPITGTTIMWGVGCSTATDCVAVGDAGSIGQVSVGAVVADSGNHVGSVQTVTGTNELYGVACPSSTQCLAVGTGMTASNGVVVRIINGTAGGAQWPSQTSTLRGIACYTSLNCVAVGWVFGNFPGGQGEMAIVVPLANGVPQAVEMISGALGLYGVACYTNTSCVAVGWDAGGSGVVVPISNGTASGAVTVSGSSTLFGVACSDVNHCAAVGGYSAPSSNSVGVVVPITNGAPGAAIQVPGAGVLQGISCPSSAVCWAVGISGTYTFGGFALLDASNNYAGQFAGESGTSKLYGVTCPDGLSCVGAGQAPPLGAGPGVIAAFGEVAGQWKQRDIAAAKLDFPGATQNLIGLCTPHAIGLLGFGTGILLTGTPTGSLLTVAGSIITAASSPFCTAAIKRMASDYRRIKDPPDPHIGQLAIPTSAKAVKLPACTRWQGAARTFCTGLSARERKWVTDAESVAATDQALATTQAREASALAAGDQTAANLQDGHIPALEQQETKALAAEASAGKAIGRLLEAHHIGYRMSKKRSGEMIKAAEQVLGKRGIAASDLQQLAPGTLTPRATNVLALLLKG